MEARKVHKFLLRRTSRPDLTIGEAQALELVEQGYSNLEIADRLGLREQTVKNQVSRAYAKVGISSRREAMFLRRVGNCENCNFAYDRRRFSESV